MLEPWTEERTKKAVDLWSQGLSAREIADKLGGTTRNAVISKLDRMRGNKPARRQREKQKRENPDNNALQSRQSDGALARRIQQLRSLAAMMAQAPSSPSQESVPSFSSVAPPGAQLLEHLDKHHCRFPIGDRPPYLFCGAKPIQGKSWCEVHYAKVYVKPIRTWPERAVIRRYGRAA
jgi:GcrA cell cycle regulator